ncbi:hypothetical protein, partial [Brevibacillus sp. SIMBA_040]|uniref:hypothetical protein n=1 Tax=Brevibacillus sp. SIMBA_040 TaxID=3085781 RepID=UPI00397C15FA
LSTKSPEIKASETVTLGVEDEEWIYNLFEKIEPEKFELFPNIKLLLDPDPRTRPALYPIILLKFIELPEPVPALVPITLFP